MPIDQNRPILANAGTASKIAPKKGFFSDPFGTGTLNERMSRGFQTLSPGFRAQQQLAGNLNTQQQQNTRANEQLDLNQQAGVRAQGQLDINQQINERAQQQFDQQNKLIDLDVALAAQPPPVKDFLIQKAEQFGMVEVGEDGKKRIRAGVGMKALQQLQDEPHEIFNLNNLAINHFKMQMKPLLEKEEKEIKKMESDLIKRAASAGKTIGDQEAAEQVKRMVKDPSLQSEGLRRINADKKFVANKAQPYIAENQTLQSQMKNQGSGLTGAASNQFIADRAAEQGDTRAQIAIDKANISKGSVAAAGATQVNLGTGTKTQLEKDIISADSSIAAFNSIESSFKPEFLTVGGKVKAQAQRQLDKLGFANNTEFLQARSSWFSQAMSAFIAYRKWATGVAGGEKEMKQIAKAYPDPENNSPAEYIANLKQSRINQRKLKKRLTMFRSIGIENPTKEQLSSIPLGSIPDDDELNEANEILDDEDAQIQKQIDEAKASQGGGL